MKKQMRLMGAVLWAASMLWGAQVVAAEAAVPPPATSPATAEDAAASDAAAGEQAKTPKAAKHQSQTGRQTPLESKSPGMRRIEALLRGAGSSGEAASPSSPEADEAGPLPRKVRLTWPMTPGAVRYQVVLLKAAKDAPENVVYTANYVYTNGVELNLRPYGATALSLYWKYCPLNYIGQPLARSSKPRPITDGEIDPNFPLLTAEFSGMDYFPEYPAFSWVPVLGAKRHEIEIYREQGGKETRVRRFVGGEYDAYEYGGYTTAGRYHWRVRGLSADGRALSDWSPFASFEVTAPTPIAALGDSITHGGGAISVPPSYLLYAWETFSAVPVKNLGLSGDTTQGMLDRFERDVLPFAPRVLVIMGGVNDYRGGIFGAETVRNLEAIREKCDLYGIIPVFMTVTPINPDLIARAGEIQPPPADWREHQAYINHWIMEQPYAIDVASALTNAEGVLDAKYTTDGLHPDYQGKRYIGETVGYFLAGHFPWITNSLTKKPIPNPQ